MFRFLVWICVSTSTLLAAATAPQSFRHPVVFEPNRGQAPASVKWIGRASQYQLLLGDDGATIVLPDKPSSNTLYMKLGGGHAWSEISGLEPTGGVSNYLLGNDPKQWRTGIPHYARLTAARVYDGIDLTFYSNGTDLEYDFVVAPGADPKQIRLAFDGAESMRVDAMSGDLLLTTAGGSQLRHVRPKVYQQMGEDRVEIAGGYDILDRRHATFILASYDRRRPLVIDPAVSFTTYLAGSDSEFVSAVAADSSGTYVTGTTYSSNFPTVGAIGTDQPSQDAFVAKLSGTGAIVFSTYLGGNGLDRGNGIAVDSTGVYVVGQTESSNFPTQGSMFPHRALDGFIAKLPLAGNLLIYSSYLGGSKNDFATGVAVDSVHAAWVVGTTSSADFPIFGGPSAGQQRTMNGTQDAFLARVAPSGLSIPFSTFAGGSDADVGFAVAVDSTDSVYATGAGSPDFPITTGMKACGVLGGAFVVRLKGPGAQTRYSTCLPNANGYGIAVDPSFSAYVTGVAFDGFQTTAGAFQKTNPAATNFDYSGFVTKLGSAGAVAFSTYLGGSRYTVGTDIAVTSGGVPYVVGYTYANDFPGLPKIALRPSIGYLTKLKPQGNGIEYSTLMGTAAGSVALFKLGRIHPQQVYVGAYKYIGGTTADKADAFVMRLVEDGIY